MEIKTGSIDVRIDVSTQRVCLVFESADAQLRMFRTMPIDEARAFAEHLGHQLTKAGR